MFLKFYSLNYYMRPIRLHFDLLVESNFSKPLVEYWHYLKITEGTNASLF